MQRRALGIVIIVIGILMMIYTGYNYVTVDKVVDLGVVQINKEHNHPMQWSPIVGVLLIITGTLIIVLDKTKVRK